MARIGPLAPTATRSESDLLDCARQGDVDAFCSLARLHEKRLYVVARSLCATTEDAEDLSQEAWLRVHRSLAGFRGDCSFYSWVRQILLHTFLNSRRNKTRRIDSLESLADDGWEGAGSANVEEQMIDRILVTRTVAAFQELTGKQRLIVALKYIDGMTYEEIARTMQCSDGTIKKALFRGIQKLREHFHVEPVSKRKPKGNAETNAQLP
jgi:RNA polymerase sigma-70 factor (ECF subfamily)